MVEVIKIKAEISGIEIKRTKYKIIQSWRMKTDHPQPTLLKEESAENKQ